MLIKNARLACVPVNVVSALLWAGGSVLAHNEDLKKKNKVFKTLADNQYLAAAATFASVAVSAFLNLYGGRTIVFALGTLVALFMHLMKDKLDKKILGFLDSAIVGILGLAAVSKGAVLGLGQRPDLAYKFPHINSFREVRQGWTNNLKTEMQVLGSTYKDFTQLNIFQSSFQLTGILRLLSFGCAGLSLMPQPNNDEKIKTDDTDDKHTEKKSIWKEIGTWLVTFSLIPAAIAALSRNPKWDNLSNNLFNLSGIFAIPGFLLKVFGHGDMAHTAGSLCTKLIIVMQMLAYSLSQCFKK